MKIFFVSVASLAVGFFIGAVTMYKPIPAGDVQVDSTSLMNLTNTIQSLRASVSNATNELAEAREVQQTTADELQKANEEIDRLKPDAQRGRRLPVSVTYRPALIGGGYVYYVHNLSTRSIRVRVTVGSTSTETEKSFTPVLGPGGALETAFKISGDNGWKGAPGDVIKIEAQGYDPYLTKIN